MKQFLAITAHRCLVAGRPSGSLDISVRFFEAKSVVEVRERLAEEVRSSYENPDGEKVEWELREVMAVDEFAGATSGAEVIGFIATIAELAQLA